VLYHYYCMKDGKEYDPNGIRTDQGQMTEAETVEPLAKTYAVSPDFAMPERGQQAAPYHLPELQPDPLGGDVLEYGFCLPSDALMAITRENGTSPSVLLSMLVGEAVLRVHPDADAPIVANIPMSDRRMLGCDETFKNCSSRAVLPVRGTPLDVLPFAGRAMQLRGALKQQMMPDLCRSIYNMLGGIYRKRMEEAADYREEIKKPAGIFTICHDTFYTDYIGSFHKTAYSDRITDVRFLCKPSAGNTLQMNVIEHGGQFRIALLACNNVSAIADALEQEMKDRGLIVRRTSVRRFSLPRASWREGMEEI